MSSQCFVEDGDSECRSLGRCGCRMNVVAGGRVFEERIRSAGARRAVRLEGVRRIIETDKREWEGPCRAECDACCLLY